jgi:predicted alpha/beta-hydrolase family hydrolase
VVSTTRILLAPGASGNPAQLAPYRTRLSARGYQVEIVALPKGKAERAMPAYAAALERGTGTAVIGGQSFGGRVATLIAPDTRPAAVVCFSYPLHAPGRRETWAERTAHWPAIGCPVLLLSGESDPFADVSLLRRAVDQLRNGRLVTYAGQGHSLARVADAAVDEVTAFLEANT